VDRTFPNPISGNPLPNRQRDRVQERREIRSTNLRRIPDAMVSEERDRGAGAETERRFSSAQSQSSPVVPEGMRVMVVVFMGCA